jgi:non-ribosomal peptide synthetase-like protein
MPARHRAEGHADNVLFNPSIGRIAARLIVEGLRIVMPRAFLIFGLGFSLQIAYDGYAKIGAIYTLLLLPAFYFFIFALPSLFLTALLKWTLIGRYRDSEWPLWSLNVWLSEAVTSTWETITEPLLASLLVGTPYLAWCFRLMGVKIGSKVTLLHSDITEYDCVSIGDEAIINESCGAQVCHLFCSICLHILTASLDTSFRGPYHENWSRFDRSTCDPQTVLGLPARLDGVRWCDSGLSFATDEGRSST